MPSRLHTLSLAAALSAVAALPSAAEARDITCSRMAGWTASIAQANARYGCGESGALWTSDEEALFASCVDGSAVGDMFVHLGVNAGKINACAEQKSPFWKPDRHLACVAEADAAIDLVDQSDARGCGFTGAIWSSRWSHHYLQCMETPPGFGNVAAWARASLAKTCAPPKITLPGGVVVQWVPTAVKGAKRGDAVLTHYSDGVVGAIMGALGQHFTHSGMVVSSQGDRIRHNTMVIGDVKTVDSSFLFWDIPHHLDAKGLRDGEPGLITQSASQAFAPKSGTPEFFASTSVLLSPRPWDEAKHRPTLVDASKAMVGMEAYYSLSAYSDMKGELSTSSAPSSKKAGTGSHCSGSIWFANHYVGNTMKTMTYPPGLRAKAAGALFSAVEAKVFSKWWGGLADLISDTDERVATQVVNCMGFDACHDYTEKRWLTQDIGSGEAVSPDNLLPLLYQDNARIYYGLQDTSGVYAEVQPVVLEGGYWKVLYTP